MSEAKTEAAGAPATPHVLIPRPDELDVEFYQATVAAGQLCIQRCTACGNWTHPARYYCPECSSPDFAFPPVSGRATVYSWTVSYFSVEPSWKAHLPYVTVVAELEEGPRIVASARGIASDAITLGMPIRIVSEAKSPDFAVFWAEPDSQP
jgi:uncharacterized OB-fold protein